MKMKRYTHKVLAIAVLLIAMALVISPVSAELQIAFTVYDTSAPDGAGNFYSAVVKDSDDGLTDGKIALPSNFQPITGVVIEGSKHISHHGDIADLVSGSSTVSNLRLTPIRIYAAVSDTDYDPPADYAQVTGSGTFSNAQGSTIDLGWYDCSLNGQGADKAFTDYADFNANKGLLAPGNLIDSFSFTAPDNLESFLHNKDQISVSDLNPFSMTLVFDYTLTPMSTYESALTSRGQGMSKYAVPEFPTLAVPSAMVVGMLGVLLFVRKTKES